jgi:quinol monooxygenase YgiN
MKKKVLSLVFILSTLVATQVFALDTAGTSSPLVVIALVKVKPGTEQSFKASATKVIAPTRLEAGNIDYNFQQSTTDPTEFATIEHWKSQADLDAHMKTPTMLTFFQEVGSDFEPGFPDIRTYVSFE